MIYTRNVSGMEITLRIDDYQSPKKHRFGDWWCDCGFTFRFGDEINYHVDNTSILMPEEIDDLAESLTKLLNGEITELTEKPMVEPDFFFILYPEKDLRTDKKYEYFSEDIYVEWKILFWNGTPTSFYLTILLDRDDIISFRDFLESCKHSKKRNRQYF